MDDQKELNDFQKAFREKEMKAALESKTNSEAENFEEEDVDTQKGRYMTFVCDGSHYGVAITYVNEIIGLQQVTELPETPEYIRGLINLRGKIVPIIDVRIRFGKPEIEYDDRTCVIVINVEDDTVGLIVDTIAEVVTIRDEDILDPPGRGGNESRYIFGIGKIGSEVKLLIDPSKLIYEQTEE